MANRPLTFNDYIGQERMKMQLKISIGAAKRNNTALAHTLVYGNPGLGKTTIAQIIANELGVPFFEVMATNLNTVEDVERLFENIYGTHGVPEDVPVVVFIDEIHRLSLKIEELFYPIMEDFKCEVSGEMFYLPKFTLIGATTLAGDLSRPLRDRFPNKYALQNYQVDEIEKIVSRLAEREGRKIEEDALFQVARRAKGVARIAISYFQRCCEYADFITGNGIVTSEVCKDQFSLMGIDELGLDENDYKVLEYLTTQSRPVGVAALATGCDIDKPTIENIIEPFLVQSGMVNRTNRGREITERGLRWIGQLGDTVTIENSTVEQQQTRRFGQR